MKLVDIYSPSDLADESEALYHAVSEAALDREFTIGTLPSERLPDLMSWNGGFDDLSVLALYDEYATDEQIDMVETMVEAFDEERVIVLQGMLVVDGHHHVVAAAELGRDIRFIDLAEAEPAPDAAPSPD